MANENPEGAESPETAPIPLSRPVNPGRSRVIRPAGGGRGKGRASTTGDDAATAAGDGPAGPDFDAEDTLPIPPPPAPGSSSGPRAEEPATPSTGPSPRADDPSTPASRPATSPDEPVAPRPPVTPATPATQPPASPGTPPPPASPDKPRGFPRVTRFQLLAALLLGALGFGLIVQARQTQDGGLSSLSQSELVRVLDDVSRQGERLDAEARSLEATQNELRSGTDRAAAAEEATRERLDVLGILAGTEPARGPGVVIRIEDPQALVDAATLLDAVQELRDAGAEAIQFGQVRVVASTSFTDPPTGGAVIADGVEQAPPYRLTAIGDPATMESALNIPGGVLETLHQVGASGTVQRRQDLDVSAVREAVSPTYAVPRTDEPRD